MIVPKLQFLDSNLSSKIRSSGANILRSSCSEAPIGGARGSTLCVPRSPYRIALLGAQPKQDKRLAPPARAGSGAGHLLRRGAGRAGSGAGRARIGLGLGRHAAPPLGLSHSIPAPAPRAEGGLRWRRGPARSR